MRLGKRVGNFFEKLSSHFTTEDLRAVWAKKRKTFLKFFLFPLTTGDPPYISAVPYAEYGSLSLTWLGYDCKELDSELTGGRRHSTQVVSRFSDDYRRYFFESYRVLKPYKYMFLMVGNPTAHGEKIDLNELTEAYAKEAGFLHIGTAIRHGLNRRGNKMGDEYLLFFQKICK